VQPGEGCPLTEFNPPIEYLLSCSKRGLRDFELAALARRADIRKELQAQVEKAARAEADAMLVNWFIQHRDELASLVPKTIEVEGIEPLKSEDEEKTTRRRA
jgi:hypothetical protein